MRKRLMLLTLGVVAFCSTTFSQSISDWVFSFPLPLSVGTVITFQNLDNGQTYPFMVTAAPTVNPAGLISTAASIIYSRLNAGGFLGSLTPGGPQNLTFGTNPGQLGVLYTGPDVAQVPFDFGISAVLGMGALASVKARSRRKEKEAAVA